MTVVSRSSTSKKTVSRKKSKASPPDGGITEALALVDAAASKASVHVFRNTEDLMEDGMRPLPADEVFDEADGAQHLQLLEMAEIQRRARQLNQPEMYPDFDGKHCVDCDREIPAARLLLKRVRCVDCQQDLEALAKRQRQNNGR